VHLAAKGNRFPKKKFPQTCVGVTKNAYSLIFYEFYYLKGKLTLVRTRKACGGVASHIHSFVTSTLDRDELSALLSDLFTPGTL
jgi:hypothetical protein